MDPLQIGLGIGSQVLGGILGGRGASAAERAQRKLIQDARDQFGAARNELSLGEMNALESLRASNDILANLPSEVLAGMDEQLRIRVSQQVLAERQAAAAQEQRMAAQGLDASTAAQSSRRNMRFGLASQMGQLAGGMAGQRANVLAQTRGMYAQGLAGRANVQSQFAQARASSLMNEGAQLMGVQIAPDQTGAAIGAIGGNLANMFFQQGLLDTLRGGGAPSAAEQLGNTTAANAAAGVGMNTMANFMMGGFS